MKKQLESLVDQYTLNGVLECLVEICRDKADHIRENWQDRNLADNWQTAAAFIAKAAMSATVRRVS